MAKTSFQTVDDYLASLPKATREVLQEVREIIQQAVPGAEEVISYNIPAFKHHGWIFYLSGHSAHFSLACPPPTHVMEEFKKELAPYKQSKSAIQFPLEEPVPAKLIRAMAKHRAKKNVEASKAKPAKKAGKVTNKK
jgi:uncharacterized protein YdhG (YjbR/CyaY superfamily)